MSEKNQSNDIHTLVFPAHTLQGSTEDILLELDREVLGLLALRHSLAGEAPPTRPNRRTRSTSDLLHRIVAAVGMGAASIERTRCS